MSAIFQIKCKKCGCQFESKYSRHYISRYYNNPQNYCPDCFKIEEKTPERIKARVKELVRELYPNIGYLEDFIEAELEQVVSRLYGYKTYEGKLDRLFDLVATDDILNKIQKRNPRFFRQKEAEEKKKHEESVTTDSIFDEVRSRETS